MKILYHHRVGSKDGQAVHIDEIVGALRALGHELVVVGPTATKNAEFGADAGVIATLKRHLPGSIYELLEFAYSGVAFLRLWRVYRRERPRCFIRAVQSLSIGWNLAQAVDRHPMMLEVNAPLVLERSRFSGLTNRRLASWVERITWRSADHVLPVTNVLAEFVRDAGVPSEKITVVQNGVGAEFLSDHIDGQAVRRRFGCADGVVLGFTGLSENGMGSSA